MKRDDPDKTPTDGGAISHWEQRFRHNRAATERALRREAGRSHPELMEPELDELSDRLERLEAKKSDPPQSTWAVRVYHGVTLGWPPWMQFALILALLGALLTRPELWRWVLGLGH